MSRETKALTAILEDVGFNDFVDACEELGWISDSIVPGACVKCLGVVTSCEPDAVENHCEECDTGTVVSVLVLAGIM